MGGRTVETCERCGQLDWPWGGCGCDEPAAEPATAGSDPAASEPEKRLLRVEVERVPTPTQVTAEQWEAWCDAHGMRTLGPAGRRAWIDTLSTYLRDAEYLVYREGELIDICDADALLPVPGQ